MRSGCGSGAAWRITAPGSRKRLVSLLVMHHCRNARRVLRPCSLCSTCQASMSSWRQVDKTRPCSESHRRKAAACLIWSPAWRRPAGVIGLFSHNGKVTYARCAI